MIRIIISLRFVLLFWIRLFTGMNKRITPGVIVPGRAQMREVKRIILHDHYNRSALPTYDYDIALLELCDPFRLDPVVRTICLPPSSNCKFFRSSFRVRPYP